MNAPIQHTGVNTQDSARFRSWAFAQERSFRKNVLSPRSTFGRNNIRDLNMIGWAITFLVIALIAAVLGFGGIAGVAIEAAKIVFFVAIVLFLIAAIVGLVRGRRPTLP
jgi:uncharacterized membrane protein YtjA (UPF0391 family)